MFCCELWNPKPNPTVVLTVTLTLKLNVNFFLIRLQTDDSFDSYNNCFPSLFSSLDLLGIGLQEEIVFVVTIPIEVISY